MLILYKVCSLHTETRILLLGILKSKLYFFTLEDQTMRKENCKSIVKVLLSQRKVYT